MPRPRWLRWACLCALAAVPAALPAAMSDEPGCHTRPPLFVKVRYGDSLWSIARRYGDPERDVREVVWEIRKANNVDPGRLQPGMMVRLPAGCLVPHIMPATEGACALHRPEQTRPPVRMQCAAVCKSQLIVVSSRKSEQRRQQIPLWKEVQQ